jgi:hypothetical protein
MESKQDVVLDDMQQALDRLGAMGKDIHRELGESEQSVPLCCDRV